MRYIDPINIQQTYISPENIPFSLTFRLPVISIHHLLRVSIHHCHVFDITSSSENIHLLKDRNEFLMNSSSIKI